MKRNFDLASHPDVQLDEIAESITSRDVIIAAVDFETNGLGSDNSVLSATAIRFSVEKQTVHLREIGRISRWYFPLENTNPTAIRVNRLSDSVIAKRRVGASYPRHFQEDGKVASFIEECEIVVGHNIQFDLQFLPGLSEKPAFCTMRSNATVLGLRRVDGTRRYPSLAATGTYYGVPYSSGSLHDSRADAELTADIFRAMVLAKLR